MATNRQDFFPPVSEEPSAAEIALHFRQLYQATNQHDRAIIEVHSQTQAAQSTAMVAQTTSTAIASAVVSAFNAQTGDVTFFPSLGRVNDQGSATAYTTQTGDNGALVKFNTGSAVAVSLNFSVSTPWFTTITNAGVGTITLTPTSGLINGGATFPISGGAFGLVYFDGVNWEAVQSGATGASGTVTLAKITGGGANGSLTVVNGLITAIVNPT